MSAIAATTGPTAYWYLTRGSGAITLILLTLTVALGVANVERLRTAALPRFAMQALHRNVSLLAVAFLVIHVATSVLDGFVSIRWIDAIVPFDAAYRPLWLGLGAVACDLVIALIATSLLRRRLGYRAWRATHWLAYASWPVAVLHSVGTGSDAGKTWMLAVLVGCGIVMAGAVAVRLADVFRATPSPSPSPPRYEHRPQSGPPERIAHGHVPVSERQTAPV
jgi:sulfoxide reductase heme-binding subunit YedZ